MSKPAPKPIQHSYLVAKLIKDMLDAGSITFDVLTDNCQGHQIIVGSQRLNGDLTYNILWQNHEGELREVAVNYERFDQAIMGASSILYMLNRNLEHEIVFYDAREAFAKWEVKHEDH